MSTDPFEGRLVGGRWTVGEALAQGGMSTVYRGFDEQEGVQVAIKVLRLGLKPQLRSAERFRREARAASRLDHPNIVSIRAHGEIETGQAYLVLDLIEGVGLHQAIHIEAPFGVRRALHVAIQIADALAHAHQNQVLHRDLKPGNVVLLHRHDAPDVAKVLDFGLAKIQDAKEADTLTRAGLVFGTPEYMAPEQAVGQKVDERCDVYALGTILFEMLAGRPPFKGSGVFDTLRQQVAAPPPRPSEVRSDVQIPAIVERITLKCLEKQPENRFSSAAQLGRALRAVSRQLGGRRPIEHQSGQPDSQTPTMGGDRAVLLDPDAAAVAEYQQLRRHRQETLRRAAELVVDRPESPRIAEVLEAIARNEKLALDRGAELAVARSAMEEGRTERLQVISQLRVANIDRQMEATRLREQIESEANGNDSSFDELRGRLALVGDELEKLQDSLASAEIDLAQQTATAEHGCQESQSQLDEVERSIDRAFDELSVLVRESAGARPDGELGQLLEDVSSFDRWISAHVAILGEKQ
jgi:hypothetical protein